MILVLRALSACLALAAGVAAASGSEGASAFVPLSFKSLADYEIDPSVLDPAVASGGVPPTVDPQIPKRIWDWQSKKVEVVGYMLPVRFDGDKVTEFMLFASPSACCFGITPRINDWINVKAPHGTAAKMDIPLAVRGTFSVGTRMEDGYVVGIYHLEFESAIEAPSLVAPPTIKPTP